MSVALADLFFTSFGETLLMVGASCLIGTALGIPLGIVLYSSGRHQRYPASRLTLAASYLTHALRATPSIVILVMAIPFTHFVLEASGGLTAALIPLSIIATPFVARQTETALRCASSQAIDESIKAGTAAPLRTRELLPRAAPGIVAGLGLTVACLVGYSTLAGALGGGGLGSFGMQYGYSEFRPVLLMAVVLVLIALAESAQALGYAVAQRLDAELAQPTRRRFLMSGRSR
ncbi:ABC transporter permease subunit [Allopusillimonas ginsengisoli]|uniref:ABC transporter permease subunit n=1 Tax=Allopusillimonas ginsengisoli TaxID=453575 RepID=UPI00101EEFF4|nr:ABC transporter permease subunit [Allopusillimonas ginsengisoli]TEA77437.1 ABC transporter permease subunit [Allopusillimonas ginsengisoli]